MFERLSRRLNEYSCRVELGRTVKVRAHKLRAEDPGLCDEEAARLASDEAIASLRVEQVDTHSFADLRAWSRRFLATSPQTPSFPPRENASGAFEGCNFAMAADAIRESLRMARQEAATHGQEAYFEPKFAEAVQRFIIEPSASNADSLLVAAPHLRPFFDRCSPGGELYEMRRFLNGSGNERPGRAGLVIGTSHEYQRHQDGSVERERIRTQFENLIRRTIRARGVDLIAEEAGNNEQMHAQLKADETMTAAFDVLFADAKVVDEPQETIARFIARDALGDHYVDIRPLGANPLPKDASEDEIAKRDNEMMGILEEPLQPASSVLVICGERHRQGLADRLGQHGVMVKQQTFPENLKPEE